MSSTGPKKINWIEAFQFYCETIDGRLPSYQDVADKFGVSKTEVGKRALNESWTRLRQELYENGKNKFLENKSDMIAEAESGHLEKWKAIQDVADVFLDEIEKDPSLKQVSKLYSVTRIIKLAIEGERIVLGLPNSVPANHSISTQTVVELPPEIIKEIDHLFEINTANI